MRNLGESDGTPLQTQDELLALIDQAAAEGWTELDLSGQGLTELPPEIGQLTQLESLTLGKVEKWNYEESQRIPVLITNSLTNFPEELRTLNKLKRLTISGNPLRHLPKVIFELESLISIDATAIGLSEIPECMAKLINLEDLTLFDNQISIIPDSIGQLTKLEKLRLYGNHITTIPDFVGQLSRQIGRAHV